MTDKRHLPLSPERVAKLRAGAARYRESRPLEVRFWEKVTKDGPLFEGTPCWLWHGSLNSGHGELWVGPDASPPKDLAHRISLRLHGVYVPPGKDVLCVDHKCRNRRCVNPAHLRLVTPRVNGTENNDSPMAKNARKTRCKHGHDLTSPGNIALVPCVGPKGTAMMARQCLTCYPAYWNHPNRLFITA